MMEAIASLPAMVRRHNAATKVRDDQVEEMRQMIEQRDQRIAQLEKELKAVKADLAGVCWVQAQLLDTGTF